MRDGGHEKTRVSEVLAAKMLSNAKVADAAALAATSMVMTFSFWLLSL